MSTRIKCANAPSFVFMVLLACHTCLAEQSAPGAKSDVPSEGRKLRGQNGLIWKNVLVKKPEQSNDITKRRLGHSLDRDNDLGLLIITSEDGGVSMIERPRYALASLATDTFSLTIRYHVYSGAASFTSSSTIRWTHIAETEETPPPPGLYEVRIDGPFFGDNDTDKKESYVITRIERNTGMCWYRSGTVWKPILEPEPDTPKPRAPQPESGSKPDPPAE